MRLTLILLLAMLFSSCERLLFQDDMSSIDPFENFDYLWNEVDQKYSYFELKNINWDSIRVEYFSKLYSEMPEDSLFKVLASMLVELRDDHTNLVSPFNISMYNVEFLGPQNFNFRIIKEHYLGSNIQYTGSLVHGFLHNNNIGYIRYASFTNGLSDRDLTYVLDIYKNTNGLILDLRSNGGGSIFNVPQLLARFVDSKQLVGYFRTRNGISHSDFCDKESFYVTPFSGMRYQKPVMILIDRGSYSATTFFALATKAIPNLILVGDTTGGGGGLPNGGQLPNGWTYRFSIGQLLDIHENNYAEEGVPPEIAVNFDWNNMAVDEIIERAVVEINSMTK
ncbi:MAG: S41 family peptidase [Salinivirgaceae bacterium]|nr:S41 family peptidase [Salinivirgaceae bacterium]MDD4746293.1 S41 family peptidase [Salinivirgaceae bacterium]MDY0281984.1 S41 family peptidase [Salinivirgaceae bacterium]